MNFQYEQAKYQFQIYYVIVNAYTKSEKESVFGNTLDKKQIANLLSHSTSPMIVEPKSLSRTEHHSMSFFKNISKQPDR